MRDSDAGCDTTRMARGVGWARYARRFTGAAIAALLLAMIAPVGSAPHRAGAQGTGSVFISKAVEIPLGSGNFPSPNPSGGFRFTITCGAAFSRQVTTDVGAAMVSDVPPGACTVTEAPRPGFQLVSIVVGTTMTVPSNLGPQPAFVATNTTDIGNGSSFTVTAGQTVGLRVINGTTTPLQGVLLKPGCNSVTSTWPDRTSIAEIAGLVEPASILQTIWRQDPATGAFAAYSPAPAAPNTLATLNEGDPLHICTSANGAWFRPQT
jgi:Domain of unknown function (DUF5979)